MNEKHLREALARHYPMGDEDPAKSPEAWAHADSVMARLRALHASDGAETPFCDECGHTWPCLTIRTLDGDQ